ncbi:MAG: zinc-dependent alcohol dehydrogenase [Microthrixaceae bacterium]
MTNISGRPVTAGVYRSRGVIEVEQRTLAPPGEGEVVVEVDYCGVCGSDLHLIVEGWGTPGDVLGHEWTGLVSEVGPGVHAFSIGDRVLAAAEPRCGTCTACVAGQPSQCENQDPMTGEFDGAFATHVLTNASGLMRVPDGMDMRTAAMAEPLAVALHAISRAELDADSEVLVLGAGPIGALAAAALLHAGHRVTVSEPAERRAALAVAIGATVVAPDTLATFDMSQVDTLAEPAYDAVIDTSGKASAVEVGFQQLRRGGTIVMVGTGLERPSFDPNRMIVMELSVRGCFVYDADGFERAIALLGEGDFPAATLVDEAEYGLAGIADAAAALADGTHAGKVMIRPGATHE